MSTQVPVSLDEPNGRGTMSMVVATGKSTLVGVLAMGGGTLDNGRGLMRGTVFRHRHERVRLFSYGKAVSPCGNSPTASRSPCPSIPQVSGRTSSISERVMGFNSKGQRCTCACPWHLLP